jgi:hypothetical protein
MMRAMSDTKVKTKTMIVFKGPVQSGLWVPEGVDRDRDRSADDEDRQNETRDDGDNG